MVILIGGCSHTGKTFLAQKLLERHFDDIQKYANVIETRMDDSYCTKELLIRENARNLEQCRKYGCEYILIDREYWNEFL